MRLKLITPLMAAFLLFVAYSLVGAEQLLFMSLVLVLLPVGGLFFSWLSLRGVQVMRKVPTPIYEGETAAVALTIQNRSFVPQFFLEVKDSIPPALGDQSLTFTSGLRPKEKAQVTYSICPEKRGVYSLGPLLITAADPIGVVNLSRRLNLADEVLVYPTFPRVDRGITLGAEKVGVSETAMARAGGGMDFYNLREYQPGDEYRRIHWKTTARTGSLSIVEREQLSLSRVLGVLYFPPASNVGEGKEATLEYAVKLMAGLAWAVVERGGIFTLATADQKGLWSFFRARNRAEFLGLLKRLAHVQESPASLVSLFSSRREKLQERAPEGVVIMAGRVDGEAQPAVSYQFNGLQPRWVTFQGESFEKSPRFRKRGEIPSHRPQPSEFPSSTWRRRPLPHSLEVRRGDPLKKILGEIAHGL